MRGTEREAVELLVERDEDLPGVVDDAVRRQALTELDESHAGLVHDLDARGLAGLAPSGEATGRADGAEVAAQIRLEQDRIQQEKQLQQLKASIPTPTTYQPPSEIQSAELKAQLAEKERQLAEIQAAKEKADAKGAKGKRDCSVLRPSILVNSLMPPAW